MDNDLMEFLEAVLKETAEKNPKSVAIAYIDDTDDAVAFHYLGCSYIDLQNIGQVIQNEGMLRFIARNGERLQEIKDEEEGGETWQE